MILVCTEHGNYWWNQTKTLLLDRRGLTVVEEERKPEERSGCNWVYLYSNKDKGSLNRIWPDPPLYSWELIQQCTASGGSFFISKSALAWSGGLGVAQTQKHRGTLTRRRRGRPGQGALRSIVVLFIGATPDNTRLGLPLTAQLSNQVTSSWQTQTHARTDVNTQRRAHARVDTQRTQPAAVANDVSRDLAQLAFCFTAWAQSRGGTVRASLSYHYW